jgi:ribosomal protein L11 methyltransferase
VTVCEAVALAAPVDLVLANILAPVLIDLAPRLQALLRPGGVLLLSGVLESQLEDVVAAYTPAMRFSPARIDQGWVCVQAVRR